MKIDSVIIKDPRNRREESYDTAKQRFPMAVMDLDEVGFLVHVDEGLAELDAGLGEDSDQVNVEIAAEFGLKM